MLTIPKHKTGRLVALGFLVAVVAGGTPAAAEGLARFDRQTIDWHGCQQGSDDQIGALMDAAGGHCGEVIVPLDHNRPGGQMITLAVSRIVLDSSPDPTLFGPNALVHNGPAATAASITSRPGPPAATRRTAWVPRPRTFWPLSATFSGSPSSIR